ncbi:MAG: hypothetical protein ABSH48_02290 [Verrucomicrobiota bacterium]|jgi:hypothetical protein
MNHQNPQLQSAIRSVLKIIGAIAAAHGAASAASILNTEDVCGLVSLVIGLFLSFQWHAPKPGGTGVPPVAAGVPPQCVNPKS